MEAEIGASTPTPTVTGLADPIFADGFENGDPSAWSDDVTDGGDLSVTGAAKLFGSYGLQTAIDDNTSIFVKDNTPTSESHYRARFHFDPNSITMAAGDTHELFLGRDAAGTAVVRLELSWNGSAYQLHTGAMSDGRSWSLDGWQAVEPEWQASSSTGANNGILNLWLDGTLRSDLTGLDTDARQVADVKLGAVSGIDSGTRGTYYFDAFESRRHTYIGPQTGGSAGGGGRLVKRAVYRNKRRANTGN